MQDGVTDSRVYATATKKKKIALLSNFMNHSNTAREKKAVFEVIRCDDVIDSVIALHEGRYL
jgi:hypothetical protein